MMDFLKVGFLALAVCGLALASPAEAQTHTRVDAKRDWSIFEAAGEKAKVCWIVSQPLKTVALRGGQQVEVRRGDIFLMVAVRPADGVSNEVSYIAGYPFRPGSNVEAKVGSNTLTMFTDGENAWFKSGDEDTRAINVFKAGSQVELRGTSSRGTTTVDTFSLLGFTAALEAAQERCK
ncbi:invasion associated locus B family protein [Thermohalobaculum xanthum]|nr:invasion associated locus B family protein [Thermohalobaculum xanthum]